MIGPCSSCIHYRSVTGSLHPIESWCTISGEFLSANDVWQNKPKAHTGKWNVFTEEVPDCKFTMPAQLVGEFDEWCASKMTLYYRENRGTWGGFFSDSRNQYWLERLHEEQEVEMNNVKRFWPGNDLAHFVSRKVK